MARIDTPFTNEHFAAWCLKMVGQPYWYGTCGYKATTSLLNSKSKQYPSHYTESRMSRYKQDIKNNAVVSDCVGGCKGYAWTGGGQVILDAIGKAGSVSNKYGSNGCPDKSANGMFTYAKSKGCAWGTIDTLPEIPGLALCKDGHVGYYVGDGFAVEWKGFAYGCVKTAVKGRGWTNWYQLPFIDYGDADLKTKADMEVTLGSRLLVKGASGSDVKQMQTLLLQLGYDLGSYGADGEFGSCTEKAVKSFQRKANLTVDGKYGDKTHAALMAAISDAEPAESDPVEPIEHPAVPEDTKNVVIVSDSGSVNIRAGNGTNYARLTQVENGTRFPYVATAENGWLAVVTGDRVGWVSGEYARIE